MMIPPSYAAVVVGVGENALDSRPRHKSQAADPSVHEQRSPGPRSTNKGGQAVGAKTQRRTVSNIFIDQLSVGYILHGD